MVGKRTDPKGKSGGDYGIPLSFMTSQQIHRADTVFLLGDIGTKVRELQDNWSVTVDPWLSFNSVFDHGDL